jgi:hypothetical protein
MKYYTGKTDTGSFKHASKPDDMYTARCGVSLCLQIQEVEDDSYWDINCKRCRRIIRAPVIAPW